MGGERVSIHQLAFEEAPNAGRTALALTLGPNYEKEAPVVVRAIIAVLPERFQRDDCPGLDLVPQRRAAARVADVLEGDSLVKLAAGAVNSGAFDRRMEREPLIRSPLACH